MRSGTWGAAERLLARRRPRHDVVFYTPWIGSILSTRSSLPPGGTETQVLALARALARRGVRVSIAVFSDAADVPADVDGVRITARPPHAPGRGVIGKLVEASRIWRCLWTTRSRTIVHYGAGLEVGIIALYALLARRRLVFASASDIDFEYRKLEPSRRYCFAYEFGARRAQSIVVQTEAQAQLCQAAFGRRPVVINSIAPLAEAQDDPPLAFLWVGRLVSYKRPLEYVALARALPEARFWMVGVPTHHHESDRLVVEAVSSQSHGVPNLEILPPRPHNEIQTLMASAVASVSTSDFEGMPNVLLEAWSRGVPALVLSYDPGGVVSTHDLGGFARGSRERLVALAHELWTRRNDRADVSRRCQTYVRNHHAPEVIVDQWIRVLSSPAGQPRRP